MCTGQVADTHQEFSDDLPTGKSKGLFKQLNPFLFCFGMMILQPFFKRTEFLLQLLYGLRIFNSCIYFKAVTNDAGIVE
ncbi:hypothetical protein D9M68_990860 [compost metagenome]